MCFVLFVLSSSFTQTIFGYSNCSYILYNLTPTLGTGSFIVFTHVYPAMTNFFKFFFSVYLCPSPFHYKPVRLICTLLQANMQHPQLSYSLLSSMFAVPIQQITTLSTRWVCKGRGLPSRLQQSAVTVMRSKWHLFTWRSFVRFVYGKFLRPLDAPTYILFIFRWMSSDFSMYNSDKTVLCK